MTERTHTGKTQGAARPPVQRKGTLRIGTPGDGYEREADRAADAVVRGRGLSGGGMSLSRIPVTSVQRDPAPKTNEEKLAEAASHFGAMFLQTELGKKLAKAAKDIGGAFIGTLAGKIITGTAAAGAVAGVAALAANHKELPLQIPGFSLFGLDVKITWEGPIDKPTNAAIGFSYTQEFGERTKPARTAIELRGEETARTAQGMNQFRAGMRYMPGTPAANRQGQEDAGWEQASFAGVGKLPLIGAGTSYPGLEQPPAGPLRLNKPDFFKPPPFRSLFPELQLELKSATGAEKKKKTEDAQVQRKAADVDNASNAATADAAPALVNDTLAASGRPLDAATRTFMENRFGHDFGGVRIHTDERAARSARSIDALAYTSGTDVVFAGGAYDPHSNAGKHLLAHELAHVVQQNGAASGPQLAQRFVQRRGPSDPAGAQVAPEAPDAPVTQRKDYVFIMGEDRAGSDNKFYTMAERFYRARVPDATLVLEKRSLAGVLEYVRDLKPEQGVVGTLYLVSHANEDGTLAFDLHGTSTRGHTAVTDLRAALRPESGASTLPRVGNKIDKASRIEIKGCDLGRTGEMVKLIDEAFGGDGTVIAPTHEQGFGSDSALGNAASRAFRAGIRDAHPAPAPVDPELKGAAKNAAVKERMKQMAQREKDIAADIKERAAEEAKLVEAATMTESLSGPMFQRPGTKLYKAPELQPEIDRLYGHLATPKRTAMASALVVQDPRPEAVAQANGIMGQKGQRQYRKTYFEETYPDPANLAEAQKIFKDAFAAEYLTPKAMLPSTARYDYVFAGTFNKPAMKPYAGTATFTVAVIADKDAITAAKNQSNNQDRYAWRIAQSHAKNGYTTAKVIAERVIAYLHHGSLNREDHEPFMPPETNPDFFTNSDAAGAKP